jgi:FKBP-type peptidyl-prolyl cis-trans isomerase SlyD
LKIQRDCIVELVYELKDSKGELFEKGEGPYLHGYQNLPPGLEQALEGLESGSEQVVALEAPEAYGDYDPDGLVSVPRTEFPPDAEIVPGDLITVGVVDDDEEDMGEMELRVHEISPEAIILDANHPLAGQSVTFDVSVVSVREASEEEITEMRQDEHEHGPDCGH